MTDASGSEPLVPPPSNPMLVARQFVADQRAREDGTPTLRFQRGDFHAWDGRCWPEAEERRVRADLYRWLEHAVYQHTENGKAPELRPWAPTKRKIADVREALQAVVHLDGHLEPPFWIASGERAAGVISMENGLLLLAERELIAHTPDYFAQHSLPFTYDPKAPAPERWNRFLRELWADDEEAIATLAEIAGYVIGLGTAQQKLFMLIGPKRSGKGTIARVLTGLLGRHNVAAPTLSGLTTNFGLSPLIGKPLALIADARLSTRADSLVAVERLLSISGEDALTVDRKYRDPWTGRLPTRFLILSNELPRFTDSSGALASRFVLLTLQRSFYGKEDPTLTDQLLAEAPGILNWALDGLDRLNERGHFVQPASSVEAIRQLEDLASPVGAFVRERCELGAAFEESKDALYNDWSHWCQEEGRARVTTKDVFVRDLLAVVPGLVTARPRDEAGDRRHVIQGIRVGPTVNVRSTVGETPDHP